MHPESIVGWYLSLSLPVEAVEVWFYCHPCANECHVDDNDDYGNNYLIAITNARIELDRIDFCV